MAANLIRRIKKYAQRYPGLIARKRKLWSKFFDFSRINLCTTFPVLSPNSAGDYKDLAFLTAQAINDTFPALCDFAESLNLRKPHEERVEITYSANFENLKQLIENYGSDKFNMGYLGFYAAVLKDREQVKHMVEIGLGTHNTDVVSNMGHFGKPGASLRAFRDYLPQAQIYGADIDKRILFEEERIKTFFVDQTRRETLDKLAASIPQDIDLIIDDGLHSPDANIRTLDFALKKIKIGGWIAIEDIRPESLPVWKVVSAMLPAAYESHLIQAKRFYIFGVRRLS